MRPGGARLSYQLSATVVPRNVQLLRGPTFGLGWKSPAYR